MDRAQPDSTHLEQLIGATLLKVRSVDDCDVSKAKEQLRRVQRVLHAKGTQHFSERPRRGDHNVLFAAARTYQSILYSECGTARHVARQHDMRLVFADSCCRCCRLASGSGIEQLQTLSTTCHYTLAIYSAGCLFEYVYVLPKLHRFLPLQQNQASAELSPQEVVPNGAAYENKKAAELVRW